MSTSRCERCCSPIGAGTSFSPLSCTCVQCSSYDLVVGWRWPSHGQGQGSWAESDLYGSPWYKEVVHILLSLGSTLFNHSAQVPPSPALNEPPIPLPASLGLTFVGLLMLVRCCCFCFSVLVLSSILHPLMDPKAHCVVWWRIMLWGTWACRCSWRKLYHLFWSYTLQLYYSILRKHFFKFFFFVKMSVVFSICCANIHPCQEYAVWAVSPHACQHWLSFIFLLLSFLMIVKWCLLGFWFLFHWWLMALSNKCCKIRKWTLS